MHDLPDLGIVQVKQILRRYPPHKDTLRSSVILSETKDLLLFFLQFIPHRTPQRETMRRLWVQLLIFSRHLKRFIDDIDDRLHLNPFGSAGVEVFDSILAPA